MKQLKTFRLSQSSIKKLISYCKATGQKQSPLLDELITRHCKIKPVVKHDTTQN